MSAPKTIKTRVLIISDTHTLSLFPSDDRTHAFRQPLPKADVLLHCGDLTFRGQLKEYQHALDMLSQIEAELKLVIAGNHDLSLDEEYFRKHPRSHSSCGGSDAPQKAMEMWKGEAAQAAGVTYLDEGNYSFTLKSGATFKVYASPYQPEFWDWAFPYERDEDRFNPAYTTVEKVKFIAENPVPNFPDVDIMMTHGPPHGHLDMTLSDEHVGCPHLLRAIGRARPRLHCFGHIHEGWGAERLRWRPLSGKMPPDGGIASAESVDVDFETVLQDRSAFVDISDSGPEPLRHGEETLLVNASIRTRNYKPDQAPWLVDMELPVEL